MFSFLSYEANIRLQDIIIFTSGILIGITIMGCLTANFIMRLEKISDGNKKLKMLRVTHKGVSKYIANFSTFKESIELVFIMAFSPMFTKKSYSLRDEKRTKRFLYILAGVSFLLFIGTILSITHITLP